MKKENQKEYLEQISKRLNILKYEDWYQFSSQDLEDLGGGTLLNVYYGGSILKALSAIYPGLFNL
jgi:hypothetical protein